jgi:hypothetical protein
MSESVLTAARPVDAEIVDDDQTVLVALKTPLDSRPVVAALPADFTLERSIGAMRKALPTNDFEGRQILDNVEREMSASTVSFLVVRPEGVVNTPRSSKLRDVASPREMRTAKGLKTVPAVAVEVQAYAGVGRTRT